MSSPRRPPLRPNARFVLRTPLLSIDELLAWSADVEGSPRAVRIELRARLRRILLRPEVREALWLASPKLLEGWSAWERDPDGTEGWQVERALVRYLVRAAGRATPFGLFAGVSVGRLGPQTALALPPPAGYTRSTRLDNDYLFALAEALRGDPEVRASLRWWPSSSAYVLAGRLRYAEARLQGTQRTYHLVAVDASEFVELALTRAEHGASTEELAQAIVEADPEIELEEARAFIDELIDSQLLVSDLAPAVTGVEPIEHMLEVSRRCGLGLASERLETAAQGLRRLDAEGVGAAPEAYHAIAEPLRALPVEVDPARLFQVDLVKPAPDLVLGHDLVAEIERGIDVLRRVTPRRTGGAMESFARAFEERYAGREVPLLSALDEESGLGYDVSGAPSALGGPLLQGLRFPAAAEEGTASWTAWERTLLRKLQRCWEHGDRELRLDDADLESIVAERISPIPDAIAVMVTLASTAEASADGRDAFEVILSSAGGPSGADLLGRFCHASSEVRAMVEEQLRAEEALRPEAVFAEVVHLGQGRIGNILCRPVLREHEIPYLGISGVPAEGRIPVQDLWVSVREGRVVLRSQRLDREVLPRMSTAHAHRTRLNVGVYRFLCGLQQQEGAELGFGFGPLEGARYLPRVRYGRVVLSRARWRSSAAELAPVARAVRAAKRPGQPAQREAEREAKREAVFEAMQALRHREGWPRWVVLADGDNELPIDLDNPLSVESAAWPLATRQGAVIQELYPEPQRMPARAPEGRFLHEMICCFTRAGQPHATAPAKPATAAIPRRFTPGGQWLYIKLYCGLSCIDAVLRDVVAPLRAECLASGAATKWFFLRYRDEAEHLRVRFFGPPERLHGEVLPALYRAVQPRIDDGTVWRVAIDTYEREVERYGGPEGIELAEQIFFADSEAVLGIVEGLQGESGAAARWRLAIYGIDRLLGDLGLSLEQRSEQVTRARDGFRREFRADVPMFKEVGRRFREERASLAELLEHGARASAPAELLHGIEHLDRRSLQQRPSALELAARAAAGRLSASLDGIAWSLMHMHVNRLVPAGQRAHELVLHELLCRHYAAAIARSRAIAP